MAQPQPRAPGPLGNQAALAGGMPSGLAHNMAGMLGRVDMSNVYVFRANAE